MTKQVQNKMLFNQVAELLQNARQQVLRTVNSTMTYTYFEIGRMIVEEEQNGKERAEYGKQILKGLSEQLTSEFGKGFSIDILERIRKFYLVYSKSEALLRIFENRKTPSLIAEFKRSDFVVDYTLSESNEQIFASEYKTILPSKEDLIKLVQ